MAGPHLGTECDHSSRMWFSLAVDDAEVSANATSNWRAGHDKVSLGEGLSLALIIPVRRVLTLPSFGGALGHRC